ncbi:FitA-like ribbon-helix-helix domain-containing protein [Georgenia yuyongxinii]
MTWQPGRAAETICWVWWPHEGYGPSALRRFCAASSQSTRQWGMRTVALWRYQRQNGAMPSVQIKDVPEDTHAILRQRAAAAHQSLQEYLRGRLIEEAARPTLDEVLDRAGGRSGGSVSFADAVATLRRERAGR